VRVTFHQHFDPGIHPSPQSSSLEQGERRAENNCCTKADNQWTLALTSKALD
jgi:hypothetical protein